MPDERGHAGQVHQGRSGCRHDGLLRCRHGDLVHHAEMGPALPCHQPSKPVLRIRFIFDFRIRNRFNEMDPALQKTPKNHNITLQKKVGTFSILGRIRYQNEPDPHRNTDFNVFSPRF